MEKRQREWNAVTKSRELQEGKFRCAIVPLLKGILERECWAGGLQRLLRPTLVDGHQTETLS
jgi:hypothetical protein